MAPVYAVIGIFLIIYVATYDPSAKQKREEEARNREMARIERIADSQRDTRRTDTSPPPIKQTTLSNTLPASEGTFKVFVDGRELDLGTEPDIVKGTAMIPLTRAAWELGAICTQTSNKTMKITRAQVTVEMAFGKPEAIVNGKRVKLSQPTYVKDSELFGPPSLLAEAFHQSMAVDDNGDVYFCEPDPYADSDLKHMILGCSVIICLGNGGDPYKIGMYERSEKTSQVVRDTLLRRDWSINNRKELLDTVARMTDHGHNDEFKKGEISLNGDSFTMSVLAPQTAADRLKWGDRGIAAWDWFRMLHLLSWGYTAGYLELPEVYTYAEPIAERLRGNFSSWDEAVDNYLDGYAFWKGIDKSAENTAFRYRQKVYSEMKNEERDGFHLFDPVVWE